MKLEEALGLLRKGEFVLLYESRENEVDLIIHAERVKPEHVARMRLDGGGLICVALHSVIADNFGLPYLTEIYEEAKERFRVLEAARAIERSAFSITVDHRRTSTGIDDVDRALTISELGKLAKKALRSSIVEEFGREFKTPGHVPILRAAKGLLRSRRGHTELSVALAQLAEITPVLADCEMLGPNTNRPLSREKAEEYAERMGSVLVEGEEVEKAWRNRMKVGIETKAI